ncbi:GumC family protein [Azospirillum isscasi]|uniref:non-specific protein-tyrosine kinase n=1 Tax=Azospirillum isscasi TaxID=3053926 RepID=A0ABU0WDP6_9PROT|nr:polysaccharide biosynthesis tyrosine autokinase [Azospirillum isscasi]MDQ2101719.1 polysaccharide biosynthesis tyrosine autokinase [Azospirillum isscasi]
MNSSNGKGGPLPGHEARASVLPDSLLQSGAGAGAGDSSDVRSRQEATVFATLSVLWRRKVLLLAIILLGTATITYVMQSLKPMYRATAMVQLDSRRVELAEFKSVVSNLTPEAPAVRSEVSIVGSRALAERVVEKLNLLNDPEFNPTIKAPDGADEHWLKRVTKAGIGALPPEGNDVLRRIVQQATALFRAEEPPPTHDAARDADQARLLTIDTLLRRIEARNDDRSYTIIIEASSVDPVKAAAIANAFGQAYLDYRTEMNRDLTERVNQWLGGRLIEAREAVRGAEEAIRSFRKENGLLELPPDGRNMVQQQMNELSTQLTAAQAQKAAAEARVRQARGQSATNDAAAIPEVLASPLIQKLREAEAMLERRLAELQQVYGDKHQDIVNLRRGIGELKTRIRDEMGKIQKGLDADLEVARIREASLLKSIAELQEQQKGIEATGIQLRDLERAADAHRTLFRSLAERYEQTLALKNTGALDAHLSAPALPPIRPAFPQLRMSLGVGMVGSTALAVALVLLLERLSSGLRTPAQVERATGVPCLGMVPSLPRNEPVLSLTPNPDSRRAREVGAFREAIQTVRTMACMPRKRGTPPKVLLVTSSIPKEGKSVLAANLARSLAGLGLNTLLIDADFRRPSIAKLLGYQPQGSVADLLDGRVGIDELIHQETANFSVLGNTTGTADAHDRISSQAMSDLIVWARHNFDVVVIDSAPVMLFSDALALSFLADSVIYVVRWQHTPLDTVMAGFNKLKSVDTAVGGVVLSRVVASKHVKYGHKDDAYYYALHAPARHS